MNLKKDQRPPTQQNFFLKNLALMCVAYGVATPIAAFVASPIQCHLVAHSAGETLKLKALLSRNAQALPYYLKWQFASTISAVICMEFYNHYVEQDHPFAHILPKGLAGATAETAATIYHEAKATMMSATGTAGISTISISKGIRKASLGILMRNSGFWTGVVATDEIANRYKLGRNQAAALGFFVGCLSSIILMPIVHGTVATLKDTNNKKYTGVFQAISLKHSEGGFRPLFQGVKYRAAILGIFTCATNLGCSIYRELVDHNNKFDNRIANQAITETLYLLRYRPPSSGHSR